jgi:hypothetical protein
VAPLTPLPDDPPLRAFVDAVVQHLSFASGETGADVRRTLRARVAGLVDTALDDGRVEDGARALLADPALLASFFQNIDLLYEGAGYAHADAVAAMVMRAVERMGGAGA